MSAHWRVASEDFKHKAKVWHDTCYKAHTHTKFHLHARILGIDEDLQHHPSLALEALQRHLWEELHFIYLQEELLWFQRSRCELLLNGDRNTKFYHNATLSRQRHNRILVLKDENNNWISEPQALKGMVVDFFVKVYTDEENPITPFPLSGCFPKVTSPSFPRLHVSPSNVEIREGLFDMHPFKALGPDSLQTIFFQSQ
ncbi:uncharacterized protein LOC133307196 [Gastrolobium bilobum]|uniref:uncharacterized protein LOC133307196 n=1 Tax=Gastrolobium bilobum TaxID=150636 RepID=UPI002AB03E25|nr:uncharacterized protein LOC133307196 [Gastrolobium bilobum]